jgi:phage shock protein A
MKFFKRVRRVINANLHAKLDKMEDPEKMIRLMLAEMEETLIEAKSSTAEKMANRTLILAEIKEAKALKGRWERRSELAVDKGKDDLAREAILEKGRINRRLENLNEELKQLDFIITSMEEAIAKLESKRQEVRDKQRILIQRAHHAQEKKKMVEALRAIDSSLGYRRFSELEEKIERLEAEAEMAEFSPAASKEKEFAQLESDSEVEAELAKLKAKRKS